MRKILLFLILIAPLQSAMADWRPLPSTQQGYELRYDPDTSRVETRVNGQARPLWDGVHRLENGQVLRINNGVAVRDRTVMQQAPPHQVLREEVSSCDVLARKSCGLGGTCSFAESCRHARQLLGFHKEAKFSERARIARQCRDALNDVDLFKPCPIPPKSAYGSACSDLVAKSCGAYGQCREAQGCDFARQLQEMEYDEKLILLDLRQKTPTTRQCEEAFTDDEIFVPCLK